MKRDQILGVINLIHEPDELEALTAAGVRLLSRSRPLSAY